MSKMITKFVLTQYLNEINIQNELKVNKMSGGNLFALYMGKG